MGRVLAALALAAVGLALMVIVAPFLLLGAIVVLALAWRWPSSVARVTGHPRLAPVPSAIRSTPMRFASSLVVGTIALTAASAAMSSTRDPAQEPVVAALTSGPTESLSPTRTPEATERPTPRPTRRPTPRPTPTPTPTPTPSPTPEPTPALGEAPTGLTQTGLVTRVVDGDTIDVLVNGIETRVRYIGMDTPEVHSGVEWLGPEASAANGALVAGKQVVLERDVSETDRYGRALRYVWIEDGGSWLLVNLELIRLGYALVTTYPPDVKYVDALYLPAQEEARNAGRGLWGVPPTPVPTAAAAPPPVAPVAPSNCEPSYPGICIPIGAADLDCGEIQWKRFQVRWDVPNPDPHRFDGDGDGIGCES